MATQVLSTRDRLFIGGVWERPAGSEAISIISPITEEEIALVPHASPVDVDRAVQAARRALEYGPWPDATPFQRAEVMRRIHTAYERRSDELATVITEEMGSPITFSRAVQAPAAAHILAYYAGLAERYEFEQLRVGPMGDALVRREPVGVVAAIVPWNYPQSTAMLKVAGALAAGCTVVLKPAPETALDAFLLAEIAEEAGLPEGVLSVLPAGREVGEQLVTHPGVDKVAFTGSTAAGCRVAALCGEHLKRATLELGGKSAAIVLDDADLETVLPGLRDLSFTNTGQTCIAQTRVLVAGSRYAEVVDGLATIAEEFVIGDPREEATEIGPLVASRQRDRVEGYIASGLEEGARLVTGGSHASDQRRGWFVAPTVFADVDNRMRIAQEEIFGPVVSVIPFGDDEDAIAIANDSEFGLSGSVWTTDLDRGLAVARAVRTGEYHINGANLGLDAPFGGFKKSGIGRELGPEGLEAYLEVKSIAVPRGALA
jgi:betaine-aldehyde dehydrogenase